MESIMESIPENEGSTGVMEGEISSGVKRRRPELEYSPPIKESHATLFKHFNEVGTQFCVTMASEKEKKKLSAGSFSELLQLKGRFDDIFEALLEENASLRGKLAESRVRTVRVETRHEPSTLNSAQKAEVPNNVDMTLSNALKGLKVKDQGQVSQGSQPQPKKNKKVKQVIVNKNITNNTNNANRKKAIKDPQTAGVSGEGTSAIPIAPAPRTIEKNEDIDTDEGFQTVSRKRISKRKREFEGLEFYRNKKPDKSFLVEVGREGRDTIKKNLWSEIVKRVSAPQVKNTRILPRGDITIKPGDEATYKVLKEIQNEGLIKLREETPNWPRVQIYDVDRDLESQVIPGFIAGQNPTLGLSKEQAEQLIKPLFRWGPKTGPTVNWICSISPTIYKSMLHKRVFLGYSFCRIVDFLATVRCYACQGYGHIASKCNRDKLVCGYCSEMGHKFEVCPSKDKPPRCANCGSAHSASNSNCIVRKKVLRSVAWRTDYGPPEK